MRVLLVTPPDTRPLDMLTNRVRIGHVAPLGLAYIAAVLEQQGVEVKILDCAILDQSFPLYGEVRYGMSDAQIALEIEDYKPDIVGVSCLFSNKAMDAHTVCRLAKMVNREIITVMGGTHPTALPEETLRDRNVDSVVLGQGEMWAQALSVGIPTGVVPWTSMTGRLDSLPFPARHLLRNDIYMSGESPHSGLRQTPVATMTTSRGCPSRCTFCAIRGTFGDVYRTRSPQNVLAEIDHLVKTYDVNEIHFEDDNLTANKQRAMAILQGIIDRQYNLTLNSPSGLAIFAMDEELIDKMREAGYYSLSFAIESGSKDILKLMRKHVDHAKAKRLIAHARSLGMKTKAFYILGYPGETKQTMQQTIDRAFDMGSDWSLFFPATPLPGTEMLKTCLENRYLADPKMDLRYYFFKANIRTPEFGPGDVNEMEEKANRIINFGANINMREGRYARAVEDFADVHRLYPDLEMASRALAEARRCYALS